MNNTSMHFHFSVASIDVGELDLIIRNRSDMFFVVRNGSRFFFFSFFVER